MAAAKGLSGWGIASVVTSLMRKNHCLRRKGCPDGASR